MNVYRPFGDLNTFFETLEKTLEDITLSFPNSDIVMVGDFNIDLNKSSSAANRIIELGLYFACTWFNSQHYQHEFREAPEQLLIMYMSKPNSKQFPTS